MVAFTRTINLGGLLCVFISRSISIWMYIQFYWFQQNAQAHEFCMDCSSRINFYTYQWIRCGKGAQDNIVERAYVFKSINERVV
ncbi:hypothetical protein BCL93_105174 [Onishia taeanensis]|uniref:Uncharacterized protein n=1 Tax=Onishia taeanensis TaxID=284577 RepID=A0A328XP38_9GAMM|nr:hypothetical protein BCL93_105174 [Halomonas taeanensis]